MKVTRNVFAIVAFSAAVLVGTATAEPTPLGLKAWGERLQGEARVYQQQQLYSAAGTRTPAEAMALHFQHEDMIYGGRQQIRSAPNPAEMMALHFQHEDALYQRQQQQQGPTALGLKAWGERLQGEARVFQQLPPHTAASSAGRFDWNDAGIGALLGFVLAIGCVSAFVLGLRFRRTQFATF